MVLLGSALLYIGVVMALERWSAWRVRRSEKAAYELKDRGNASTTVEEAGVKGEVNLSTKDLVKVYGGKLEAVKKVNLNLHEKEVVGLLGPNGAGKSSTFNMVTLQTRRTCGDI